MGYSDAGSYKMLLYSVIIILVLGFIIQLVINPFIDEGYSVDKNPTFVTEGATNIISYGIPFNFTSTTNPNKSYFENIVDYIVGGGIFSGSAGWVISAVSSALNPFNLIGQEGKDYIITQIQIFSYLPEVVQYLIGIPIIISLITILYILITTLWSR